MHELGVVFHIIKMVDKVAEENNVENVKVVTLEVGEVSAIVPHYFIDCWKWAVNNRSSHMHDCELKIETIKAITICNSCGCKYETVKHAKICPNCKSEDTVLKTGNEVIVKDITV